VAPVRVGEGARPDHVDRQESGHGTNYGSYQNILQYRYGYGEGTTPNTVYPELAHRFYMVDLTQIGRDGLTRYRYIPKYILTSDASNHHHGLIEHNTSHLMSGKGRPRAGNTGSDYPQKSNHQNRPPSRTTNPVATL
jgi:hypothetical protein